MSTKIFARVAALSPITNQLPKLLQCKIKAVQTTQSSDTDLRHYCNNATAKRHHGASRAFTEPNRCKISTRG
jgi:hypothetical protein